MDVKYVKDIIFLSRVSTETTITRGGKQRYSTRRNGQFIYLVARKVMKNTHMRSTYERHIVCQDLSVTSLN